MMWVLGVLTTAVFWGLIIWGVVALFGWARRNRQASGGWWRETRPWRSGPGPWSGGTDPWGGRGAWYDDVPQEILGRRLAAGEIDEEEYHRRLAALRPRQFADAGDRG
jgi:putative membrane protein